jgi:hypothetical protein
MPGVDGFKMKNTADELPETGHAAFDTTNPDLNAFLETLPQ